MITHTFSKLIIYGAGYTAVNAYTFLGYGRVECFATSDDTHNTSLYNKRIISYENMIRLYREANNYLIVIAADNYYSEMENNLRRDGISNYIIFHTKDVLGINDYLPFVDIFGKRIWKSYSEVLSYHNLEDYKRIYVYGKNEYINYLYIELMAQAKGREIIITENKTTRSEKETFLRSLDQESVVIINIKHNLDDIRQVIDDFGSVESIDLYDVDKFQDVFIHRELSKYRNIHAGERIFIVGNGPSLTIGDLEKLHANNALSIAFNKIYKVFDKTEWRPTYVGITDPDIATAIEADKLEEIQVFQGDNIVHWEQGKEIKNATKFHLINSDFYPNMPLFSENVCTGTYRGCSVTYDFGLQFAVYMGCSEIILIGMDHGMSGNVFDKNNHFCADYFNDKEKDIHKEQRLCYRKDEITLAYEAAKKYAGKQGIRIFNSTRGGNLEVFERVDFDDLFSEQYE